MKKIMNDTSPANEPTDGDLVALAEFFYDRLPRIVQIDLELQTFKVLDVHALADVDNAKMVVNAAGIRTPQTFGPGTYYLIQVEGIQVEPDESGLTAFPLVGELPEGKLVGK
jgi:hypothetical protein